ncbi:MAG: hypothetical protein KDH15_04645, partial [Rhodocyclaceae bacterium]|nr:hypothetical protein [Rhodocyclaceae bacterium]
GVRLTGRYAVDPDDGRGAYRVQDASGETVFERYHDYGSADDASQQFAADALRAEIAALQSSDLGEWFSDIVGAVDPLTDSLDVLTEALGFADEVARQSAEAERVRALGQRDALEDARIAGLSAASSWFHSGEVIRDAAAAGALSVEQLSQLAAEHYANEVRLLSELARASEQVAGMFSDTASSLEYQALATDQARYDYLQAEADQILDVISGLLDPDEIVRQSQRLQQVVGKSFGLLDPEQQAAELPDFLDYLADANTYIQDRIEQVTDTVVDAQVQTNDALADAMIAGIGRAVDVMVGGLQRAADAIPSDVDINLRVTQAPAAPGQQAPFVSALGDGP